ncbi:MAG: PAS domain S-box protein [Bacteroidetes bacterium]|nr:PAS domain S-box protein [Bacteroidota bacterium]
MLLRNRSDIRIALIFFAVAGVWILFSDAAMFMLFPEIENIRMVGTLKGMLFITVTGLLLFWLLHRDLRIQREKQEEIRALNTLLTSVLEPIEEVLFVLDTQHRLRYVTKGSRKVTGVSPQLGEGISLWHVLSKDLSISLRPLVEDVLCGGDDRRLELRTEDDRVWSARSYPVQGGAALMLTDITERRVEEDRILRMQIEREEALIELRMHIDRMPIAYIVTDCDFRLQYFNPAAENMFGYSMEEVRDRQPYGMIFPEEEREALDAARKSWGQGRLNTHDRYMNRRKDGRLLVCDWFNTPVLSRDGSIEKVISMVQDVTEATHMVEALRMSEERFRLLFERANDGILTIHEGVFTSCNQSAARMLKREPADIIGKRPVALSPPLQSEGKRSSDMADEFMKRALKAGGSVFEWLHHRGDGTEAVIEVSLSRVDQNDGSFLLCLWRDVTLRRKAEEELITSHTRLRALAVRLDEVREEERLRLSRELHDGIGQLLTGIKIDMSLLRRYLGGTTAIQEPKVEQTISSVDRLLDDTIVQTRELARSLRPGLLDEVGVVSALRMLFEDFEIRSGITCSMDLTAAKLPLTSRQRLAVYRIAQEAITNITRHAGAGNVAVTLQLQSERLMFEIHDDGRGVRENELKKPGSLGIVNMTERAELLGGFCRVFAAVEGGTTVHIEFPVHPVHERSA